MWAERSGCHPSRVWNRVVCDFHPGDGRVRTSLQRGPIQSIGKSIGKSNSLFYRLPRHPVLRLTRTPHAAHPGVRLARGCPRRLVPPGQGLGTERPGATLPVGPDSNMMRAIEETDFSNWCKVQMPHTMRCPASLRCAIQGMTCTPFWQCSNISSTWWCGYNLMLGNGYRATHGTSSPLQSLCSFRCFVPSAQCRGDATKHLSSCHKARK